MSSLLWRRMWGIFTTQTWRMGRCHSLMEKFGISFPHSMPRACLYWHPWRFFPHSRKIWLIRGAGSFPCTVRCRADTEDCHGTGMRGDVALALAELELEGPRLLPAIRTNKTEERAWEASESEKGDTAGGCRLFFCCSLRDMYKPTGWIDDGSLGQRSQGPQRDSPKWFLWVLNLVYLING